MASPNGHGGLGPREEHHRSRVTPAHGEEPDGGHDLQGIAGHEPVASSDHSTVHPDPPALHAAHEACVYGDANVGEPDARAAHIVCQGRELGLQADLVLPGDIANVGHRLSRTGGQPSHARLVEGVGEKNGAQRGGRVPPVVATRWHRASFRTPGEEQRDEAQDRHPGDDPERGCADADRSHRACARRSPESVIPRGRGPGAPPPRPGSVR
jgi:hypothetical protein